MNTTNNSILKSIFSVLIRTQLLLASKPSLIKHKVKLSADSGFQEINIGYNDGLRVQDSSGVDEWSPVSVPDFKRCDFRQINVLCMDTQLTTSDESICQLNCNYRGYNIGICYSEPGPGNEPSGEWQQSRGAHYCYCSHCHSDKCMQYCHNFGFATGYCHESSTYGTGCKCVGCDASFCGKHCNNVYGTALQQSLCRHNDCKCLAKTCDQN